ncbi:TetR family transcriptional regulator [Pseudomonas sp. NPDC087342]|uniref:TetR family transcriptional regulator n=1 Tax=Pseudomonas sp. NPDC087342 TaxID=3364437 RepID=UPI0037F91D92
MSNPPSPSPTRKDRRREEIRLAILRIEKGRTRVVEKGRKLSIIAVAEETGISAAAIHNHHPDMADLIRRKLGVDMREQRNSIAKKLKEFRSINKDHRDEIALLKKEIALLASHNATLMLKNSELNAIIQSDNVKPFPSQ